MLTVYGTDWCDDTRRALRHLRRLGVAHHYLNVDEDLKALEKAVSLNGGVRRTPTIDVGVGGAPLVEPDNDTITAALVELEMLTEEDAAERLGVQNVGDVERVGRTIGGLLLIAVAAGAPRGVRWALRILGAAVAMTGLAGWDPVYHRAQVTSLGGPGDRPAETARSTWLAPRTAVAAPRAAGAAEHAP